MGGVFNLFYLFIYFIFLQVLAPVSTASTSFMSLLNTTSNVIHHIVLGELPFGYGGLVFVVGALGEGCIL